jgi:DNA-binding IclR family transcriptional regulator
VENGWSLLTNHGLALVCLAREPGARLRDIADCVGVTERAAHRIVCELEESGYLTRHRLGRRNFYELHAQAPLRHELMQGKTVGELLSGLVANPPGGARAA